MGVTAHRYITPHSLDDQDRGGGRPALHRPGQPDQVRLGPDARCGPHRGDRPRIGDHREVSRLRGSWSDITDRKRAEAEVAAARARIEHLLASSPAVIYSFKATGDYAPTFISQNVKELLGYDREEYLNSPDFWESRIHPKDSPRILRAYSR